MSDYLTPAEVERLTRLLRAHNMLFGTDTATISVTLRAYAEIVEAVATMDPYDTACIFCGRQAWDTGGDEPHAPECIYLRARGVRRYE